MCTQSKALLHVDHVGTSDCKDKVDSRCFRRRPQHIYGLNGVEVGNLFALTKLFTWCQNSFSTAITYKLRAIIFKILFKTQKY